MAKVTKSTSGAVITAKVTCSTMVKAMAYNTERGILTITHKNGSQYAIKNITDDQFDYGTRRAPSIGRWVLGLYQRRRAKLVK